MTIESLSLFDYIILIILGLSIIFSFIKGFIQSLLGLLTWVGAAILTLIFYENLSNFLSRYMNKINFLEETGLSLIISTVLSIPFIFLVSLIFLKKIKSLISTNFQKSSIGNLFDKLFGIIYGFFFGLIIISITIITVNKLFNNFSSTKFIKNSTFYIYLEEFNNKIIFKYTPLIIDETGNIIDSNSDNLNN